MSIFLDDITTFCEAKYLFTLLTNPIDRSGIVHTPSRSRRLWKVGTVPTPDTNLAILEGRVSSLGGSRHFVVAHLEELDLLSQKTLICRQALRSKKSMLCERRHSDSIDKNIG